MTFDLYKRPRLQRYLNCFFCIVVVLGIYSIALAKEVNTFQENYIDNPTLNAKNLIKFSRFNISNLLPGCPTALNILGGTPYYDNDCMADLAVWRPGPPSNPPTSSTFYTQGIGLNNFASFNLGTYGDKPLGGDYDGDARTDYAVYTPNLNESDEGHWYIVNSSNGNYSDTDFGTASQGDFPLTADIDGDQKSDILVFRLEEENGVAVPTFFKCVLDPPPSRKCSTVDYKIGINLPVGLESIVRPFINNFNVGNSAAPDFGIWNGQTGEWTIRDSATGVYKPPVYWGMAGDIPVPGAYKNGATSDHIADIAVWRPVEGTQQGMWYILNSEDGSPRYFQFGLQHDLPVPGDYDGDGYTDIAVWRPSNGFFYIMGSSAGSMAIPFGMFGDIPIALPYPMEPWVRHNCQKTGTCARKCPPTCG